MYPDLLKPDAGDFAIQCIVYTQYKQYGVALYDRKIQYTLGVVFSAVVIIMSVLVGSCDIFTYVFRVTSLVIGQMFVS